MVVGQTLMRLQGSPYFSPTFPRGGLGATFAVQLLSNTTNGTLSVQVQHKNTADTAFLVAGSFPVLAVPGTEPLTLSTLKEELRFSYAVGGVAEWDAVHFNVLAPAWRPY